MNTMDVFCGGIEHKLGYRGCPICQLIMGENKDCRVIWWENLIKALAICSRMME